ncbi:MAG TPA: NFACT RNA binding domain-containing protein [Longimicrobiales bacterium]
MQRSGGRPGWQQLDIDGFEILVGRSARDNDELTFRVARPRDLWLHASGHAGSHVVIRAPEGGEDIPRDVIDRAAAYAAWHSKARNARGKVEVHVCRAADVRKPHGAPAGTVELRRYDVVRVYPREIASRTE